MEPKTSNETTMLVINIQVRCDQNCGIIWGSYSRSYQAAMDKIPECNKGFSFVSNWEGRNLDFNVADFLSP